MGILACSGAAQSSGTPSSASGTKTSAAKKAPAKSTHSKTAAKPGAHKSAPSSSAKSAHSTTHARSASRKPGSTATHGKSKYASTRTSRKHTPRGQQKIDPERAQEIQAALIREHYLTGEASGSWNESSEAAMRRYQEDHGWQSKTVPDARALISLGLGPSNDHLLNPDSAMTTEPPSSHAAALAPESHSAAPTSAPGVAPPADPPPVAASPHDSANRQ